MRLLRKYSALLVACAAVASTAVAQVEDVAITIVDDDYDIFGTGNTDASLAVNDEAVCISTNMEIALFDRSGMLLDSHQVDDTSWPFLRVDESTTLGASRFFDPQTEYDPHSGRIWMVYAEENATFGSGNNDIAALHLAVSKEMVGLNELDSFSVDDWWYYSDDTSNEDIGYGGTYFDLTATMTKYRPIAAKHNPYPLGAPPAGGLADKAHMSIDEQAAYIQTTAGIGATLLIIPLEHGTSDSILEGSKPANLDLTFMRFVDLDAPDNSERHFAVQEPVVDSDFDNAQFFLSFPQNTTTSPDTSIRMGGIYYDDTASQWEYRQRLATATTLDDMDVSTGFDFYRGFVGDEPGTPDSGCSGRTDLWSVWRASDGFIPSAVLVKDAQDNSRIFAVHAVAPVDDSVQPSVPEQRLVIQWYVIDPDLNNFRNLATTWDPQIITTGRIDSGGNSANRFHPVIGVNPQGVAFIEYTYVDDQTWPEIRRAQLSINGYSTVASDVLVQAGPQTAYIGDNFPTMHRWADFADMQADPSGCGFWSVHTLVSTDDPEPCEINARDIWLFENDYSCNNANMNGDSTVNVFDLGAFNDFYMTGARRADMNIDGVTDTVDAAIFTDEYDKAQP